MMEKAFPQMKVVDHEKWEIDVICGPVQKRLKIPPVESREIIRERYEFLPEFQPDSAGWLQGVKLRELTMQECTAFGALIPESLQIEDENGKVFLAEKDYRFHPDWGTVGRIANGRISPGSPVFISYRYYPSSLDSIVLKPSGEITVHGGEKRIGALLESKLEKGEKRLGNIYFSGKCDSLSDDMLFPVQTRRFRKNPGSAGSETFLPKSMKKLQTGRPLNILAWGDSVTEGAYLRPGQRYQEYFLTMLRKGYPASEIALNTLGWGGRTTKCYFEASSDSPYHYEKHVLNAKPDLVISEFVNDAGLPPDVYQKNYERILSDFRRRGIEWIILTPHYILPSWMKLSGQKNINDDPRGYVIFLRDFAKKNSIALADASLKYGQLWQHGIPYMIYMVNGINHPDRRGMKLFANTLMEIF